MRRAAALVLLSAFLWGTTFPATKLGLQDGLSPLNFLLYRFLVATACLGGVAAWRGRVHASYFLDWRLWLFALLNALGYLLQYVGQSITTASKTSLLVNVNVLVTALCAALFLHERISRGVWIGLVVGTVGVTLLTTNGRWEAGGELVGDVMALGTGVCWTIVILGYKAYMQRHPNVDAISMNLVVFTITLFAFAVAALMAGQAGPPVAASEVAMIVYLGVFATAFAFLAWQAGLRVLTASLSSVILLFETVVALVLSALLLGEALTGWSAAGAVLVLAAMYLASRSPPAVQHQMATGLPVTGSVGAGAGKLSDSDRP